ncbi:MAG: hypothetical protein ACRDSZ_20755 [Pseudonocardiaceae bacterium]
MSTPDQRARANDQTINVTCTTCSSGKRWCNLRVTRLDSGDIVLDPHVTGACVIVLDDAAVTALFALLGQWRE